jgi:hypothetical protein
VQGSKDNLLGTEIRISKSASNCSHTHTHTHTHVHTYTHTYTHTYIHTYIHIHIHTHTRTYIHIYIHTYIHMYIYTYIPKVEIGYIKTCMSLSAVTIRSVTIKLPTAMANISFPTTLVRKCSVVLSEP